MAQFPRTKPEMMELANQMIDGFAKNPGIFPSPTVPIAQLQAGLNDFILRHNTRTELSGRLKEAIELEEKSAETLEQMMKGDLAYATTVSKGDPAKLILIGWGPRKQASPVELPGPATSLEITKTGTDSVFLTWKSPRKGGRVGFYKIRYRQHPSKEWLPAEST